MVEGFELNVYFTNGDNVSISLSDMQIKVISKVLGLELDSNYEYKVFSDEGLKKIFEMNSNPLKLEKIKE